MVHSRLLESCGVGKACGVNYAAKVLGKSFRLNKRKVNLHLLHPSFHVLVCVCGFIHTLINCVSPGESAGKGFINIQMRFSLIYRRGAAEGSYCRQLQWQLRRKCGAQFNSFNLSSQLIHQANRNDLHFQYVSHRLPTPSNYLWLCVCVA